MIVYSISKQCRISNQSLFIIYYTKLSSLEIFNKILFNLPYKAKLIRETTVPFIILNGTTVNNIKVARDVILGFKAVPIATILSSGIPYIDANLGNKYTTLNNEPNIVSTKVPATVPTMNELLVLLNIYIIVAGNIKLIQTTKFANSPTKAVVVDLKTNLSRILQNSVNAPAKGP